VTDPPPTVVVEGHADAPPFERPHVDEDATFELSNEVGGRLPGDEQATADLAGV